MCYDALKNGDATDRPLGEILRAELSEALINGLAAAAMVAAVLFLRGAGPGLAVALTVTALALGVVVVFSATGALENSGTARPVVSVGPVENGKSAERAPEGVNVARIERGVG